MGLQQAAVGRIGGYIIGSYIIGRSGGYLVGRLSRSLQAAVLLAFVGAAPVPAQTLAHRNWEGSGLTAQPWWTRAAFCDVDPRLDPGRSLPSLTAQLDRFQSIGCDALVLDLLSPTSGSPVALASGTLDDADELIDQMGRRKIRLVLHLPLDGQASLDRMRFWLSRGVAGFVLRCTAGQSSTEAAMLLHQAHLVTATALGARILIAEGIASPSPAPGVRHTADAQLAIRRISLEGDANTLRAALAAKGSPLPLLAVEPSQTHEPLASTSLDVDRRRIEAAILLGNPSPALLPSEALTIFARTRRNPASQLSGQPDNLPLWVPKGGDPLGPTPDEDLLSWYRSLAEMRHSSPALRTGEATYLNRDNVGILAWVVRPRGSATTLLFVCNLSGHTVHLSLAADLRALAVRGTSLHTLLTTEAASSLATVDAIDLQDNGVLAAELR